MACQLGAPTKEVFHNRPGHLITFQTEFRLWGVAMLGNPYGDDLFALHLKATSTYQYLVLSPVFSPFPRSHIIFYRFALGYNIKQILVPSSLLFQLNLRHTQTTQTANLAMLGGMPLGLLWQEFSFGSCPKTVLWHLGEFLSLSLSARPPVLFFPPVPRRAAASPVSQPVCAWKRFRWAAGVGDFSSELTTVQSPHKGSHLTLAFVFPSMKIVHTMTDPLHCQCSSWHIPKRPQWTNSSVGGKGEDTGTV